MIALCVMLNVSIFKFILYLFNVFILISVLCLCNRLSELLEYGKEVFKYKGTLFESVVGVLKCLVSVNVCVSMCVQLFSCRYFKMFCVCV